MQMVLSAVINNASEAIPDKGLISVSVRAGDVDENFSRPGFQLEDGTYLCLRIEDTGKGMSDEILSKIFDPFFSTKFLGRGLGMAAVHGIVKNHSGMIIVDSHPGKGTIVRIYMPAAQGAESAQTTLPSAPEPLVRSKTVLVVEDEAMLMGITCTMLEKLGYQTLKAETGEEALSIVRTYDGRIDLVLLDIKLPDMSGEEVYGQLTRIGPDIRVIVCSGYAVDGPVEKLLAAGAQGFIQKPFTFAALSAKLSEAVD